METPLEEETPVGASAINAGPEHREELKASDQALAFMASIEPAELQKCVFPDSLVTVSEGGRDLGKFTVTVEFACRVQRPCLLLRAQSQGAIDDAPCGTIVTVYLSTDLEVLEEDYHEYVKLEDHSLDKRCHMVQHDGQMVINKVTTIGEEVMKESVSYPMSALRGLVTEGSNLLLMRLIALRKMVPEHMTFISFDQGLYITHTIFSELGLKQLEVDGEAVEVFGVERIVHSVEDSPTTWQCYFLDDGHLANRVQVGSPVTMRLLQLPSHLEKGFEKIPLVWEEDMQMRSMFLDRKVKLAIITDSLISLTVPKQYCVLSSISSYSLNQNMNMYVCMYVTLCQEELMADHASYLRQHPEIRALISDFLQFLLLRKPDNVFQFAREYFQPFASHHTPEQCLKAHSF